MHCRGVMSVASGHRDPILDTCDLCKFSLSSERAPTRTRRRNVQLPAPLALIFPSKRAAASSFISP